MSRTETSPHGALLVHVVCPQGAGGLAIDRHILQGTLQDAGHQCLDFPHPGHGPRSKRFRLHRLLHPSVWLRRPAINIFLEQIDPQWISESAMHVLLPNPEWLREPCRALLPRMQMVLCKTRDAESIFDALGCRTVYVGFTSRDLRKACALAPLPDPAHYASPRPLHVAGASHAKGSAALVEAWRRHPEWPTLTLLARPAVVQGLGSLPENVRVVARYLPDGELHRLMTGHNLHLCPSEAEGWGHSIVEAMGCAAAVLSTDGAPMNELVQPDRGVLVPVLSKEPMGVGCRYRLDVAAVEAGVAALLAHETGERMALGHAARRWFESNDHGFRARLAGIFAADGAVGRAFSSALERPSQG